ncbi:hypothetical protein BpHYR1_013474 [Brachionus plicatilis]|uniref:Uncharacterized protein n=1 Tax=Brachionus plicatilis TaxID=10195 RepID=A0A3M7SDK4_BRAPC|nr:hypothetical protein BpHYR1_013474 [Brachionus plicatilis]
MRANRPLQWIYQFFRFSWIEVFELEELHFLMTATIARLDIALLRNEQIVLGSTKDLGSD